MSKKKPKSRIFMSLSAFGASGGGGDFSDDGSDATRVGTLQEVTKTTISSQLIPVLQISVGLDQGKVISFKKNPQVIAGRSKDCVIVLQDPSCSRKHAEFVLDEESYKVSVTDLNSTNGTLVNGQKIQGQTYLQDGDRIKLGDNSVMRFGMILEDEVKAQMDVYKSATRDALTGAYNRKRFEETLMRELSSHKRGHQGLGLILFDVDHFKKVNDTYGHDVGDGVLKEIAERVSKVIRSEDLFCRVGGEEFTVIVRNETKSGVQTLSERLRAVMEATPFTTDAHEIPFTISIGVMHLEKGGFSLDFDGVYKKADEALYASKKSGRNKVSFAEL